MSASVLNLRAQRVSFSYGDRSLLDDVTFHLPPGWTGLVGANGSGKTTLLRLGAAVTTRALELKIVRSALPLNA